MPPDESLDIARAQHFRGLAREIAMEALAARPRTTLIAIFAGEMRMADEDFELWLGSMGSNRSTAGDLRRASNLAGGRTARGGQRRFTGERIGRGAATGRLLGTSGRFAGHRARRVVVKTSYVKLSGKGAGRAAAHMRYLQRDGTTREGDRGALYSAGQNVADGAAFRERGAGDRHQFRFIVAAEDGAEYEDLKPLVRRLMAQAEKDLGTKLDWVAVDHFNTGHPHSHVLLRGKDMKGADLVIAREYLTRGLRMRATELVNLDLGPRSDIEILRAQTREVGQERVTDIDRRLVASVGGDGLVSPASPDGIEQAARAGRLQKLGRMGLAKEERRGQWRLSPDLEPTLRAMGKRGDIIATLHANLSKDRADIAPADYAIHDPVQTPAGGLVGRVLSTGLSDEQGDRRYGIIDAVDGRAWHVDFGVADVMPKVGSVVRVRAASIEIKRADRVVAEIAAAHGGRYSVDIHMAHDRNASETFADTHVRRLEAVRRAGAGVEREVDGTWIIAPDHVAQIEAMERRRIEQRPIIVETLASVPVHQLARHDGVTWLDRELVSDVPARLERGFGAEVRHALDVRRQWLVEQELMGSATDRPSQALIGQLQRRDMLRAGAQLSREIGIDFADIPTGQRIEGTLRRIVAAGDSRFALVERSHDFTLVPWRPMLEKQIGKRVSGLQRLDGNISWTIGRERGLGL